MTHSVLSVAEIGKLIRAERKRQKILQQDLADLSGVSLHFLSNLENGKASVEFQKVILIFRSLGIEMQLITASFEDAGANGDSEACQFHLDRFKEKVELQQILLETLQKQYFQVFGRKTRPATDPN